MIYKLLFLLETSTIFLYWVYYVLKCREMLFEVSIPQMEAPPACWKRVFSAHKPNCGFLLSMTKPTVSLFLVGALWNCLERKRENLMK